MKLISGVNNNNVTSVNVYTKRLNAKVPLLQSYPQDTFEISFCGAKPVSTVIHTLSAPFRYLADKIVPKIEYPFEFRFENIEQLTSRLKSEGRIFNLSTNGRTISVETSEGKSMTYHFRGNGSPSCILENDAKGNPIIDYEIRRNGEPSFIWMLAPRAKDKDKTIKSLACFDFGRDNVTLRVGDGPDSRTFRYDGERWKRMQMGEPSRVGENGEDLSKGKVVEAPAEEYQYLPDNVIDLSQFSLLSSKQ